MTRNGAPPHFRPLRLARLEAAEWVAYYRRDWLRVLTASYGLVREGFGLGPLQTVAGAWLVFRANQAWAPFPDNDPERCRAYMTRFYALVRRHSGHAFDPVEAARLEVGWWAAHRALPRDPAASVDGLSDAIARLYAYMYRVDVDTVRESARLRALAMQLCDRWVAGGREDASPLLRLMGNRLLRSYQLLSAAVG